MREKKKVKMKMCIAGIIIIIFIGICYCTSGKLHGKSEHIEGDNIEVISSRFTNLSNILKCCYEIDIVSAGGIGPVRYNIRALIIIDEKETKRLKTEYNWIMTEMIVDEKFYKSLEIEEINEWLYCKDFCSETLKNGFVGEVYFSEKGNCICIFAGM